MLMIPLHNRQQILGILEGQLADVGQTLLLKGAQNGSPVTGHRGFLGLQGAVQAGIAQVGHWPGRHHHCRRKVNVSASLSVQSQLTDVRQALLLKEAQDGSSVAGHWELLRLQGTVQAGIAQVGHQPRQHHHCTCENTVIAIEENVACQQSGTHTPIWALT